LFSPALIDFCAQHPQALDHLAVIPDRCWTDPGPGAGGRFKPLSALVAMIARVAACRPLVMQPIGLSICSAEIFDAAYVGQPGALNPARACALGQ